MAKHKQTRLSVSLARELYNRGAAHAKATGIPLSQLTAAGLEAVLAGRIPVERQTPNELRAVTIEARVEMAGLPPDLVRAPRRYPRMVGGPKITLSEPVIELVEDVADRQGITPHDALDGAVNRMLDHCERTPGWLCTTCLEGPELCSCRK
jgi:hypothetical protein